MFKAVKVILISTIFVLSLCTVGSANIEELKIYRKVFPNYKPNCSYCHVSEKPKKEDGQHELNGYGAKLKEMMNGAPLTEEIIIEAGDHETFIASQEETTTEKTEETIE